MKHISKNVRDNYIINAHFNKEQISMFQKKANMTNEINAMYRHTFKYSYLDGTKGKPRFETGYIKFMASLGQSMINGKVKN